MTGLNEEATEEDLQDLFGEYGDVRNMSMALNRRTGYVMVSRGLKRWGMEIWMRTGKEDASPWIASAARRLGPAGGVLGWLSLVCSVTAR